MLTPSELASFITPDCFSNPDHQELAEIIGVENTLKVLMRFEGSRVRMTRHWRIEFIAHYVAAGRWDGKKASTIARDLGVSERVVQRVLASKMSVAMRKALDKQAGVEQLGLDF